MTYNYLIGQGLKRWTEGQYTSSQLAAMTDYNATAILMSGSYRSGKSEALARLGLRHALHFHNARCGVFRAKLKNAKESVMHTFLQLTDPSWVEDWNNSNLTLRLITGSTIQFMGADFPDRIGSIELTEGYLDESHEISEESYGMINGRLSGTLTPVYSTDPGVLKYQALSARSRRVYLACNPKSKNLWLYKDFIDPDTRKPGRAFYTGNSITNPNLPPSYLSQTLMTYVRPGVSRELIDSKILDIREGRAPSDGLQLVPLLTPMGQRNLLGLWVALEGAIYELDPLVHKVTQLGDWGEPYRILGVDFGYHNPRIVELSIYDTGHIVTTRYWAGSKDDHSAIIEELALMDKQHPWHKVFMPHDQPGVRQTASRRFGASRVLKARTQVNPGIGATQSLINGGTEDTFHALDTGDSHFDKFWQEMTGYQWKPDKDGVLQDEPVKEDDHFPDAFRYAYYTALMHRGGKAFKQNLAAPIEDYRYPT